MGKSGNTDIFPVPEGYKVEVIEEEEHMEEEKEAEEDKESEEEKEPEEEEAAGEMKPEEEKKPDVPEGGRMFTTNRGKRKTQKDRERW